MKLLPAILLSAVLALGTAACGDNNDNGGSGGSGGSGDSSSDSGGSGSSNADVKAYCDAVKDFVDKVDAAVKSKDASQLSALQGESQDLADKAAALATANLSTADGQEVANCTKDATSALSDLGTIGQ